MKSMCTCAQDEQLISLGQLQCWNLFNRTIGTFIMTDHPDKLGHN